tara:strand:+ start:12752 stop:13018 length:267 start_codon:yes stop_codon:yes gene_type:complete
MEKLLSEIRSCELCKSQLPFGPDHLKQHPPNAQIVIIGQASTNKDHQTGTPSDDPNGNQLRKWFYVTDSVFYDERKIALMPMVFCYPV